MSEEKKEKTEQTDIKTDTEKKVKKKKDGEKEKLKAELENAKDLLLRTAAEFDNYKKRTERERLSVAEISKASVIKELLPVIDNIDRSSECESGSEDYIKGIEMIVKQLLLIKDKLGMVSLANTGDEFNPEYHEAVMHIESEDFSENTVSKVLQQGYKIGDTVIRPAMVEVAN